MNPLLRACLCVCLVGLPAFAASEAAKANPPAAGKFPDELELKALNARLAPTPLVVKLDTLPENERRALAKIVEAAQHMDVLFLRQVWAGNESLLLQLLQDTSTLGQARLHAFMQNKGPWLRLDHDAPFVPGVPAKPDSGNFYPVGLSKAQVEAAVKRLPPAARTQAMGFFTTLRTAPDGKLSVVPYSVEYQGELSLIAEGLREAAELTKQPTLKKYLTTRAAALLSNDYYASEVAWMELDATIEPTIGPYEVYEDNWFNYKAAYEAFVGIRDDAETKKLARFSSELQELENNLPIDKALKNPKLAGLSPIRVVNQIFNAGDANRGVQTAAYALPNDERVRKEKGTKRVMLKNVQEAKFSKVLVPIGERLLSAEDRKHITFDAFFTHILMHELMHALGPQTIKVKGKATTVRQALQKASSAIEEAKADVSGLWALQYLVDQGKLPKEMEASMYRTYLASMFRSIRFGVNEAHGKGVAMQLNYFLDAGAVTVQPDGTFAVVHEKVKPTIVALTRELMMLQAKGDRAGAEAMLAKLGVVRPEVQKGLDALRGIPVDIEPQFVTADELLRDVAGMSARAP